MVYFVLATRIEEHDQGGGSIMQIARMAWHSSVLWAGLMLSGCATFEGAPQRVISEPLGMSLVAKYPIDEAIKRFSYPDQDYYNWTFREGLNRQQYRDMV